MSNALKRIVRVTGAILAGTPRAIATSHSQPIASNEKLTAPDTAPASTNDVAAPAHTSADSPSGSTEPDSTVSEISVEDLNLREAQRLGPSG